MLPPPASTRRAALGALASATAAGCLGRGDEGDAVPLEDHPATEDGEGAPRLGPDLEAADGVIVEFGDPSCSQCATFDDETFPTIRANLVDTGRFAYLWRPFPIVQPWGSTAAAALLATYDERPAAFTWLKRRYYDERETVTENDVLERTLGWLDERDDVDGAAIRAAVENGRYEDRLDAHRRAAEGADVSSVPSFVLFSEGTYVTTVVGPQPYGVFEGALDV